MKKTILILSILMAAAEMPFPQLSAQTNSWWWHREIEPFIPANPPELKPIASHDTPAHRAAKLFQRGINIGHYLEVRPHQWEIGFSVDEFEQIRKEGFDHVRLMVNWPRYAEPAPDFTLPAELFSQVDRAVTKALNSHLAVILDLHHFHDQNPQGKQSPERNPKNPAPELLALWRQIAEHYRSYPPQLAFDLDNEPSRTATTAVMNPVYAQLIAQVRQTNPERTLFVEPGSWSGISELKKLVLPPDDNIIVSVHQYDPMFFTHQGANWDSGLPPFTGVILPGPPSTPLVPDSKLHLTDEMKAWLEEYNTLPADKNPSSLRRTVKLLEYAHAWSDYYGRPVHIGEFGALTNADPASRANYYSLCRHAMEKEKIIWTAFDWRADFGYWDSQKRQPLPGMREALLGE